MLPMKFLREWASSTGRPRRGQLADAAQHLDVLVVALAEGDAGVDGDLRVGRARPRELGEAVEHPGHGLGDHVRVARRRIRAALGHAVAVVEDVAGAALRGGFGRARAEREAADVVHDFRARSRAPRARPAGL